jgi:uncharacterized protein
MKGAVWTLGVEDGSFPARLERESKFKTLLVAVLLEDLQLQAVDLSEITVDGLDATDAILSVLKSLDQKPRAVILGGISYAGFNFIDPFHLQEEANLPSIILTTERPNNQQVRRALQQHFPDWKNRWSIYRRVKTFKPIKANPKENPIFMETVGLTAEEGERIVKRLTKIGRLPEPLRVARMIARSLTTESYLDLLNS